MNKVNDRKLAGLIFACAAVQLITLQNIYGAYSAQLTLLALLAKLFIFALVLMLLIKVNFDVMSKRSAWLAALVFLISCAGILIDGEAFYRYTSEEPLDTRLVLIILLAAVCCALIGGDGTVVRTAQISAVIIALSAAVLVISNIKNAELSNLSMQQPTIDAVMPPFVQMLFIPAEVLLLFAFCTQKGRASKGVCVLLGVFVLYAAVLISVQLVFGREAQAGERSLQMLTRVGSISVFKRLDAVYVLVWLFAIIAKAACMLSAAKTMLSVYMTGKQAAVITVIITAVLLLLLSFLGRGIIRAALTVGIIICVLISLDIKGDIKDGSKGRRKNAR